MSLHIRVPIDKHFHMAEEAITGIGFYCISAACRAVYIGGYRKGNWICIKVPKLGNQFSNGMWPEPKSQIKRLRFHSVNIDGKAIRFGVTNAR